MPRTQRPSDRLQPIGRRLRAARLALGLRTKDMAESIGAASNTYSQWESGDRLLDVLVAVRIAECHKITLDWLYRGNAYELPAHLIKKVLAAMKDQADQSSLEA
jgi:transcriptional regulator with XRE-family HTH domain